MKKKQTIWCADETCKYNRDGLVCESPAIELGVYDDSNKKAIVVCTTYEDKREEEDG